MKALVLSNINIEPIRSFLKSIDLDFSGFNDFMLNLADPSSKAHKGEHEIVIIHLDADALLSQDGDVSSLANFISEFGSAVSHFSDTHPGKTIILNTLAFGPLRINSYADAASPHSLTHLEVRLNGIIRKLATSQTNIAVLDLELLYRRYGYDNLISESFWYLGRIKYNNAFFKALGRSLEEIFQAYLSQSKKVLVLDLDNTLWGGVLGEEGANGQIKLSEEGTGKIYRDFQRLILSLKDLGILLAINSKNNPQDVDEFFRSNEMMVLKVDDFVAVKANWDNKLENMQAIAQELSVSLDSFVFIDDNAVERKLIRDNLPEVAVPEFPKRIETLCRWFLDEVVYPYFPKYRITAEDQSKHTQYKSNAQRLTLSKKLDLNVFIQSLEIKTKLFIDDKSLIDRASQLSQKTNQFNVTTKRYSPADIQRFMESKDSSVLLIDYEDRFGKEGIIGMAILDFSKGEIDSFLMSCRVISRGVEKTLMKAIEEIFRSRKESLIKGLFIPSKKNHPAQNFFPEAGFQEARSDDDGRIHYQKELT